VDRAVVDGPVAEDHVADGRVGQPPVELPADTPVVETHVSVLVFLDDVVLKLKKPVRFPFVDFTSLEARRRACEEEVRCNRRLAPDVYLGVAETRLGDRPLDYAVAMRRLPADRSLEAMVRRRDPGVAAALDDVAAVLASFHRAAARSPEIDCAGELPAVLTTWEGLVDGLRPFAGLAFAGEVLEEADRLAERFLRARRPLFAERVAAGRICDGHGDILASDVFVLDDGPRILDAVEFDPRLRQVDVAADIAFLAMDLERLGVAEEATRFVRRYEEAARDRFPWSLFHYYCGERAAVRAMVACLRDAQMGAAPGAGPARDADTGSPAGALLSIALGHLRSGRVVLGVVSGLPGTGKSTVAAEAGAALRWPVLRSDEVRRELTGAPEGGPLVAALGSGPYAPDRTAQTYEELLRRARAQLGLGQSVLLDATFIDGRWRHAVAELAEETSSDLVVVETTAPVALAAARADDRRQAGADVSGAGGDVVRALAAAYRAWPGAEQVDTSGADPAATAERVRSLLCPWPAPIG